MPSGIAMVLGMDIHLNDKLNVILYHFPTKCLILNKMLLSI